MASLGPNLHLQAVSSESFLVFHALHVSAHLCVQKTTTGNLASV